jgi:hypothetical protein
MRELVALRKVVVPAVVPGLPGNTVNPRLVHLMQTRRDRVVVAASPVAVVEIPEFLGELVAAAEPTRETVEMVSVSRTAIEAVAVAVAVALIQLVPVPEIPEIPVVPEVLQLIIVNQ